MSEDMAPSGMTGRLSIDEDGTIITSNDESYRTCTECGGDCIPEAIGYEGLGVRWLFVCPPDGVQALIDPFSYFRQY